jgi:hypothetical protein
MTNSIGNMLAKFGVRAEEHRWTAKKADRAEGLRRS